MRAAEKLCVVNCVADRVRLAVPQPTERQRIGNYVDTAMVFARSDFVSAQHPVSAIEPSITTSKTNGIVIFISGNFGLMYAKRLHGENRAGSFGI
jgi:hypothetical protein